MKSKYIVWLVLLLIVVAVVFKLSANKKKLNEKNAPAAVSAIKIPVQTDTVKAQYVEINITKTGNLAPFKEVKVVALTGGTLRQVNFKLGDKVIQGQVLAVSDNRSAQLDLQKAETNAAKLKDDLDTYTQLLQGKAATQEKVNSIRKDYQDAQTQINQAKRSMADALIKAPTSGIISIKSVEQGVFVNTGADIATIVNLSRAKVQVNLTEAEVYKIAQGQQVKITTDVYPGKVFSGRVDFISPQADQAHNYMAELMIENAQSALLRSGTFVYADFSRKTQQKVLVIAREALTESVQNASVYVVTNNMVHLKKIQAGNDLPGGKLQVLSGLNTGDVVVTAGQINLKEGTAVSLSK